MGGKLKGAQIPRIQRPELPTPCVPSHVCCAGIGTVIDETCPERILYPHPIGCTAPPVPHRDIPGDRVTGIVAIEGHSRRLLRYGELRVEARDEGGGVSLVLLGATAVVVIDLDIGGLAGVVAGCLDIKLQGDGSQRQNHITQVVPRAGAAQVIPGEGLARDLRITCWGEAGSTVDLCGPRNVSEPRGEGNPRVDKRRGDGGARVADREGKGGLTSTGLDRIGREARTKIGWWGARS